jgi:hypothetical protein
MKMPQKPFIISPNPASEMLTIESQFQTPYVLAIYNAMGQVVIQKQMQGLSNETIFLEALSKGCYLIKASDGQELFSEKLVVE